MSRQVKQRQRNHTIVADPANLYTVCSCNYSLPNICRINLNCLGSNNAAREKSWFTNHSVKLCTKCSFVFWETPRSHLKLCKLSFTGSLLELDDFCTGLSIFEWKAALLFLTNWSKLSQTKWLASFVMNGETSLCTEIQNDRMELTCRIRNSLIRQSISKRNNGWKPK